MGARGDAAERFRNGQCVGAKKILEGGDLLGAISLLQGKAAADNSRKGAFRRMLAMAALCMRGNQPSIARPLLEDLNDSVEKLSIDKWDPALTLEVWTNLHKCYESLAAGSSAPNKQAMLQLAEGVFQKICRLDVGYALASTGTKSKGKPQGVPPKTEPKQTNGGGTVVETVGDAHEETKATDGTNSHPQS